MRYLVDTHVFIWFYFSPERLPKPVNEILKNRNCQNFLSVVSVWEMQIKITRGKLSIRSLRDAVGAAMEDGVRILPFTLDHIYQLENLPKEHKDPFDRALVAQAICESLTIITRDAKINDYEVPTMW